ncbi:unnamed protein product [Bursaphelenchus okinawaensis]|uniref:Mediator of RNA polymerase II transcription subunit 23 n=1 Tax=Bursaphelenchus okinawaensis TaxID=465554 RepID=A0A811JU99_9BILA|nr:unnamed protein product [Bursaphelenchus okinawaensis]CAG9083844.1 unnamed protein product [Bursaphelenchus okinawaensis]
METSVIGQLVRNSEPEGSSEQSTADISTWVGLKNEKRIAQLINRYVETNFDNSVLGPFIKASNNDDAIVMELVELMKHLDNQRDLELCINAMVTHFLNSKKHLVAIDNVVTKVLFELHKHNVAPVLPIAYGMINSLDIVRFQVPINKEKITFVREHLKEIDYKGMREILKLVLVEKLDRGLKHHQQLEGHQILQLLPLEEMTIELLDRYNNFYPSLFIVTEVFRIYTTSPVHKLPRLSEKIRNVVASFRPLADVTTFIGRPWAYPVTAMLTFSPFGNNWRFSEHGYRSSKTHLPYVTLSVIAQAYPLYMIMKQPRSQHCLNNLSKRKEDKRVVMCDEMLHILIHEAMCVTENTKKKVMSDEIQYNWRHIMHMCTYAISHKCASFPELLKILKEQMKSHPSEFVKARGELMWLILQCVSLLKRQFPKDEITEIYNILYAGDPERFSGSSADSFGLVRYFVPAAIWMNMSKENSPPPALLTGINYLKEQASNPQDEGILASCANAYCNDETVFNTEVCTQIMKKISSAKGIYELPFKQQCPLSLEGLEIQFLDLLTTSAKNQLFTYMLFHFVDASNPQQNPSPAIVESLTKILLTSDNVKSTNNVIHTFINKFASSIDRFTFVFFDILAYRLKNTSFLIGYVIYRIQIVNKLHECLPPLNSPAYHKLPQYVLMEQILLRQVMTAPAFDVIPFVMSLQKCRFNIFLPSDKFGQELLLCPEVVKLIITQFIMSIKLIADCDGITNLHIHLDMIKDNFRFPECTAKWLSPCLKDIVIETSSDSEDLASMDRAADAEIHQLNGMPGQIPQCTSNTLIVILKAGLTPPIQLSGTVYKMVKSMSIYDLTVNLNRLVDYVIHKCNTATSDSEVDKMLTVLNQMIFNRPGIPVERFLMALIVHPNDNKSIKIALILLHTLLSKADCELTRRLRVLYTYVPTTNSYFHYKSSDFFAKQMEYHKKYFDYADPQMEGMPETDNSSDIPVLMYYSNLAERLVPLIDFLFIRCFEYGIDAYIIEGLTNFLAPLYRYHPNPITSLYRMVFVLEKSCKTESMGKFVKAVGKLLDDDRQPKYPFLTQEFIQNNHSVSPIKVCDEIVKRVTAASTYIHEPPEFVVHDWRLAEFPPAAQAVTSGCLELMLSSKKQAKIVEALVGCMLLRAVNRPYDRLNSIALILTHLPKHYQEHFYRIIEKSFDWSEMTTKDPEYMLSSFTMETMQYRDDRMITLLALIHSFIQHACCDSLAHLCNFIQQNLAPKVVNETQLIYFLRILAVYLSKVHGEESKKELSKAYLHLIITIYDMIPRILKNAPELKYEDLVCDLLYQFKYTVTGFSVTRETEEAISRFPKSMQCKLKFLQTQGVMDMSDRLNKSIPHASLLQVIHAWQLKILPLAEYNSMKAEGRNPAAFHGPPRLQIPNPQLQQHSQMPPLQVASNNMQSQQNPPQLPSFQPGYHNVNQPSMSMPSSSNDSVGLNHEQMNMNNPNVPPQQHFGRPNMMGGPPHLHPSMTSQHGHPPTSHPGQFPGPMMPGQQYGQMGMRGSMVNHMPPPYFPPEMGQQHIDAPSSSHGGPAPFMTGQMPNQMGPGQMPSGQMPPGSMPSGQMAPGSMSQGQMPPGQMGGSMSGPGQWPQNMMMYQGQPPMSQGMPMSMPNQQMHNMPGHYGQGPRMN